MPQSAEDVAKKRGHTLGPTTRDRQEAGEERSARAFKEALKTMGKKSRKRGSK